MAQAPDCGLFFRAALQLGDLMSAGNDKARLEQLQREEKHARDERGDSFQPRWFRLVHDPVLLPGEEGVEKVPFWESTGEYMQSLTQPIADPASIFGTGFNPWQYPETDGQLQ